MNICVYFLSSGDRRKSYIGYSTCLHRRLRQHRGILKGGAKYTSHFNSCELLLYMEGFPTKRDAMRMEWWSKRRRLKCHNGRLIRPFHHKRVSTFLAPIRDENFQHLKECLTIQLNRKYFSEIDRDEIQRFYDLDTKLY